MRVESLGSFLTDGGGDIDSVLVEFEGRVALNHVGSSESAVAGVAPSFFTL